MTEPKATAECPTCGARVERVQPSYGIWCAYPCVRWLAASQARQVRRAHLVAK